MNYELLKKLKDAGFRQKGKGEYIGGSGRVEELRRDSQGETVGRSVSTISRVYIPTLSELIAACGNEFGCLNNNETFWQANHCTESIEGIGPTPEEAVAMLWLQLNRK